MFKILPEVRALTVATAPPHGGRRAGAPDDVYLPAIITPCFAYVKATVRSGALRGWSSTTLSLQTTSDAKAFPFVETTLRIALTARGW
jgi:hypothetical protein